METVKISVDFSTNKYSDKELNVKTNFIIGRMTGNTHFPSPLPALSELKECNDRLGVLITKMVDGNKQTTVDKNNVRAELETLLKKEANYVQQTSNGDEVIIATSGFDVIKKRSTIGPLPMVTGLTAKAGPSRGSLEISWNVVPGAMVYELKYTEAPVTETSIWTYLTVSKHRILLENLVRGKQIAVQVVAVGSDPSRNWSDEITSYVM